MAANREDTTTTTEENATEKQQQQPKIVVFTFPPVPELYNMSPFGIKLESYLRVNGIPYDIVYTTQMSSQKTIPYIHLDGKEVSDSNVILERLQKEGIGSNSDKILSKEQMAVAHAMTRMIEEHMAQIGFYYRYGLHMKELIQALDGDNRMFCADLSTKGNMISYVWKKIQPGITLKKTKYRGLSRSSNDELWKFSNDDILALSRTLGDKPHFFGQEATTLDCVVFGHLAQFLYIPQLEFPQKQFIVEKCPNLIEFMKRFKSNYWSDWEQKCQRKINAKFDTANNHPKKATGSGKKLFMGVVVAAAAIAAMMYFANDKQVMALQ